METSPPKAKQTGITVRAGREADLEQVACVLVDTWRSTFTGRLSAEFLDGMTYVNQSDRHRRTFHREGVAYFVACGPSGEIIGFVSGGPIRYAYDGYEAELYALYVRQSFQGQGVGSHLVRSLMHDLVCRAFPRMLVRVLAVNPNIAFYERIGARALATQRIQLGPDEVDEVGYVWDKLAFQAE